MRTLLLAGLALAGCRSAPEELIFEDGRRSAGVGARPLPERVTLENAREVVRICLQRHADLRASIHYLYLWRRIPQFPDRPGFTQVRTLTNGRECTVGVEFLAIAEIKAEKPAAPEGPWTLRLRGKFTAGRCCLVQEHCEVECPDLPTAAALEEALLLLRAVR